MAEFTYSTLTTAILNFTETDTSVLSSTITDQLIGNAEERILEMLILMHIVFIFKQPLLMGKQLIMLPQAP